MFGLVLSFPSQTRMLKKKKKSSQNPDIIIHEIEFLPSLAMIGARGNSSHALHGQNRSEQNLQIMVMAFGLDCTITAIDRDLMKLKVHIPIDIYMFISLCVCLCH